MSSPYEQNAELIQSALLIKYYSEGLMLAHLPLGATFCLFLSNLSFTYVDDVGQAKKPISLELVVPPQSTVKIRGQIQRKKDPDCRG